MSFDEYDLRSPQDIEHDMCQGYELSSYDKQSLNEIERLLSMGAYTKIEHLHDHTYFVEHLLRNLETIRQSEVKEGFPTFDLDHAIVEIRVLFKKLNIRIAELENHTY